MLAACIRLQSEFDRLAANANANHERLFCIVLGAVKDHCSQPVCELVAASVLDSAVQPSPMLAVKSMGVKLLSVDCDDGTMAFKILKYEKSARPGITASLDAFGIHNGTPASLLVQMLGQVSLVFACN